MGRASPASVVALNPAEQASSPRSGEVPHEAARKSPSARSSAALSSNREDRPPQVSGNASELSLLRASPGKPRHDGDARERISDAELHDQEPGEGGSVPAERESLRAAGIAPANGGHEVLQGEVKATSANKEGEASIVPQVSASARLAKGEQHQAARRAQAHAPAGDPIASAIAGWGRRAVAVFVGLLCNLGLARTRAS